MRRLLVTALLAFVTSMSFAQIPVTFKVDLHIKAKETIFNPATDSITIHGDFMTDAGLGSNWFPGSVTMKSVNNDSIYVATVKIDSTKAGTVYNYKFTINDKMWEGDPNRQFTLQKPSVALPVVWFDRDSILRVVATNTLNFTADLSSYYGTGAGFFDPSVDSLMLMGLDWVGATVTGGQRKFKEDPFHPGIFHAQMIIKGFVADSTKWKCKAYPDANFANGGWEFTSDKWYRIQGDGTTANIPSFVPDIWPLKSPTTQDVKILFQVDMTHAVNQYNNKLIDPKTLTFVGIKGQHPMLGAWVGDWLATDTSANPKTLIVLNDKGQNGDKVAGDNIWSVTVTIPKGDAGGPYLYKYGAFYPGSDTLNNKFHPGDNEMQPNINHFFILINVPKIEIYNTFGSVSATVTGVPQGNPTQLRSFSLGQNYPNPFNPSTNIRFSVPMKSHVSLDLYNMLGQKVATLVNGEENAGEYNVVVDARTLASGVYFYKLQAGDNIAIKKMMLLK